MIKIVAPKMTCDIVDRAIQTHGGAGISSDHSLGYMYANARTLRLADGPDEVHMTQLAKGEILSQTHAKL